MDRDAEANEAFCLVWSGHVMVGRLRSVWYAFVSRDSWAGSLSALHTPVVLRQDLLPP